jgi:hypothetical protein
MSPCVLVKLCKETSGMSPCVLGKVVRQPFGSSGFLDPLPPVNELFFDWEFRINSLNK